MDSKPDAPPPPASLPRESPRAYAAFLDYFLMGDGRSLAKLAQSYRGQRDSKSGVKPPTRRLSTLEDWSVRYQWQERLKTYQADLNQREIALWAERQKEIRQKDWEMGTELRSQVERVLAQMPQFIKTTRHLVKGRNGEPDREIVTIQQDLGALLKAAELASKLQRLAADMPDSHQQVDHTGSIGVNDLSVIGVTPAIAAAAQAALRAALEEENQVDGNGSAADSST